MKHSPKSRLHRNINLARALSQINDMLRDQRLNPTGRHVLRKAPEASPPENIFDIRTYDRRITERAALSSMNARAAISSINGRSPWDRLQ